MYKWEGGLFESGVKHHQTNKQNILILLLMTPNSPPMTDTIAINVNFYYNVPAIIQNLQKRSNVLGVSNTVTIVSKHVTYFGP
jgi:hypothetical protein